MLYYAGMHIVYVVIHIISYVCVRLRDTPNNTGPNCMIVKRAPEGLKVFKTKFLAKREFFFSFI